MEEDILNRSPTHAMFRGCHDSWDTLYETGYLADFLILGLKIKTREAMGSQSRNSVLFLVYSPFKGTVSVISKKPSSDSQQYPLNLRRIKDEGECAIYLDRKSIQKVT